MLQYKIGSKFRLAFNYIEQRRTGCKPRVLVERL